MRLTLGGVDVYVHTGGMEPDPGRPPVFLIHGAGCDHTVFRFLTRALAHRGFAAYAPDLPAHGNSGGPPLTGIEDMANFVTRLMDTMGVSAASLVGHSMGSLVAVEVAASYPERVDKLCLICTSGEMQVNPRLQDAADRHQPLAVELMVDWMHTGDTALGGHPQPGSWSRGVTRRLLERHLQGPLAADLRACAAYPGLERASKVSCPTLVIAGTRDLMTPARAGVEMAARIPDSQVELMEGAGHALLIDRPRSTLGLVQTFLSAARSPS